MALNRRDIAEQEEFEKTKAMLHLMCKLNEGRRSGEEECYLPQVIIGDTFIYQSNNKDSNFGLRERMVSDSFMNRHWKIV